MSIINLLNQIKQNSLAKKKYFYYSNIKNLNSFLKKLIELGIINVQYINSYKLKIFLIYNENNESFYQNIKILYTLSRKINIKTKTLKKIKKFQSNSVYILSTTKGFKTNFEALQINQGGILICKFNY